MIHTLKVDSHTSLRVIHLTTEVTSVLTLTHKFLKYAVWKNEVEF